jgi:hypothetical protein
MKPDLDTVAAEFTDIDLVVIDAATAPESVSELRVFGTPTIIAVRNGSELARFTGRRTRSELRDLFTQLADGAVVTIPKVGRSDRLVWTIGGAGLTGVGLLMGPAWPLVAIGLALVGYANYPRNRA